MWKALPLRLGIRQRRLITPRVFQHLWEMSDNTIRQEKEIKGKRFTKEAFLLLFADDMVSTEASH